MNTDIDENDCIVIQTEGSEVGKRSAGLAGSTDFADAGASAPSQNAGEGAEDGIGGWAMVTRRKAKASGIGSGSSPTAKTARVFASTSELERKRKAEQSLVDQVTALCELVTQLVEGACQGITRPTADYRCPQGYGREECTETYLLRSS